MRNIFGVCALIITLSANSELQVPKPVEFLKSVVFATTVSWQCEDKGASLTNEGSSALSSLAEGWGGVEKLLSSKEWKELQEVAMSVLDTSGCKVAISATRKYTREIMGESFLEY
jgi:hypothetical protein